MSGNLWLYLCYCGALKNGRPLRVSKANRTRTKGLEINPGWKRPHPGLEVVVILDYLCDRHVLVDGLLGSLPCPRGPPRSGAPPLSFRPSALGHRHALKIAFGWRLLGNLGAKILSSLALE